jgi:hypothetical protein
MNKQNMTKVASIRVFNDLGARSPPLDSSSRTLLTLLPMDEISFFLLRDVM